MKKSYNQFFESEFQKFVCHVCTNIKFQFLNPDASGPNSNSEDWQQTKYQTQIEIIVEISAI
jgi:hypothetical protein